MKRVLSNGALAITADVAQVDQLLATVHDNFGGMDLPFNNAELGVFATPGPSG